MSNQLVGRLVGVTLLSVALVAGARPAADAASFTVNSVLDQVDAAPGNGQCAPAGHTCTLRAAIQATNAPAGDDVVNVLAGTFLITIAGADGDLVATGDVDDAGSVSIVVA